MAEMVVIGAIVVLPIWILADAGSIKAPCQPEHRKERKPMQSVKAPEAMDKTWKSWVQETAHDRSRSQAFAYGNPTVQFSSVLCSQL
eukprot:CAMPEP_0173058612 /NCGR_PEP_ID=MMETSP1102-20130122/1461_1 /TAXON_ID=49646 /ORGANISM="Geminigera sp., Strain Caron Lab Isolate" /LENGTH=86 /DNA_ID=CAMNT_0013924395 /DNA_START=37 /DNA_END=297 /DNA_ORIENTATION=+